MVSQRTELTCKELNDLCKRVKQLIEQHEFEQCKQIITNHMCLFPDAPQPHNLYGILLEKQGDHALAMRHFRVAWSLDPTYDAAEKNMEIFSNAKGYLKSPIY